MNDLQKTRAGGIDYELDHDDRTAQTAKITSESSQSLTRKAWERFRRHKLAMFGSITFLMLVGSALFAPWISQHEPNRLNLAARESPPTTDHWLGTDRTGRDIWVRVLYGGRVSLSVGIVSVTISTGLGILIGSIAGFFGGLTDNVLMRLTDMVMTFPSLIIIIVLVAAIGPNIYNVMFAIGLLSWPQMARIIRGQFLSLREEEFVLAARSIGVQPHRIIFAHILPNALSPIIVAATFGMGTAILMEAGLSFLGLGVQPPTPSWGNMLRDAQSLTILQDLPWMWIPPGVLIVLAVLSVNFIGDGLRDALDPRHITR